MPDPYSTKINRLDPALVGPFTLRFHSRTPIYLNHQGFRGLEIVSVLDSGAMAGSPLRYRSAAPPKDNPTTKNNAMPGTSLVVEDEHSTKSQGELTRFQEVLGLSKEDGNTVNGRAPHSIF